MNAIVLFVGAFYGFLVIIFGAFGAHFLKKKFTADQLASFETGVKYQLYHAIVLVALSLSITFDGSYFQTAAAFMMGGVFLFSFSIYGLCLSSAYGKKLRFLGPITPLGGLFLATGWFFLMIEAVGSIQ